MEKKSYSTLGSVFNHHAYYYLYAVLMFFFYKTTDVSVTRTYDVIRKVDLMKMKNGLETFA